MIKDYLFNEQVRAIDVIFLSLLTSFVLWIVTSIFKKVQSIFSSILKKVQNHIIFLYKIIVKKKMNVSKYIEIEKRLEAGGKLKWYEKKAYFKAHEEISKGIVEFKKTLSNIKIKMPKLRENQED
ncbi:hypothetical protein ACFSL6_01440 [Paenibacillus thailandensis]|uniref:Uncharacterized protein n=1 Tax=Paenibacillus thailandensis TaxID=393250 RepID=A0ABW5R2X8_9BACL